MSIKINVDVAKQLVFRYGSVTDIIIFHVEVPTEKGNKNRSHH